MFFPQAIAAQKAGIIKRGCGAVLTTAVQPKCVAAVLRAAAADAGAPLHITAQGYSDIARAYTLSNYDSDFYDAASDYGGDVELNGGEPKQQSADRGDGCDQKFLHRS